MAFIVLDASVLIAHLDPADALNDAGAPAARGGAEDAKAKIKALLLRTDSRGRRFDRVRVLG